jgi:hypothetical protein
MKVERIPTKEAIPWILTKHYARRVPSISYAFGLFDDMELVGICTYGTPSSSPLRCGICGPEMADRVLELNRVCCTEGKNQASELIGKSLRLLPKPSVVVSFADTAQGHVGVIYQATNWIYTGLSAKRTDWKVRGMEHLHGATIADKSRGVKNRAEWMREVYGDDFYLEDRPRKHRYIFFVGSKSECKEMLKMLRYDVELYPKGKSSRYDSGPKVETQGLLL